MNKKLVCVFRKRKQNSTGLQSSYIHNDFNALHTLKIRVKLEKYV